MKVFLLNYSTDFGAAEEVKVAVRASPYVAAWRYDLPYSMYLLSERTAKEIAIDLRARRPNGRFMVTELGADYWGWNTDATWYLFANKTLMQVPPAASGA